MYSPVGGRVQVLFAALVQGSRNARLTCHAKVIVLVSGPAATATTGCQVPTAVVTAPVITPPKGSMDREQTVASAISEKAPFLLSWVIASPRQSPPPDAITIAPQTITFPGV